MGVTGLNSIEKKAAFSLASVFGLRMLGLFMILPVFAIYGTHLEGYSPIWLGLAIGAYGLTQALLQIPMGLLSDKFGRKPVILFGLLIFMLGSIVAATSTTIYGVILGRALQGMGAIASAILALAADLTREEQRPKVMATIGMFIGVSFMVAMVLGPIIADFSGLSGLFWFIVILTVFAMVMIQFMVPDSVHKAPRGDNVALPAKLLSLVGNEQLARLNFGVFALHMAMTACFVVIPSLLVEIGFPLAQHWQLYLPVLLGSFFFMLPFMIIAMKKKIEKQMFAAAVLLLVVSLFLLWFVGKDLWLIAIVMFAFFVSFNYLEATMPAFLSRIAPAGLKGTAMGMFSSSQFFGAFLGGVLGGVIESRFPAQDVFLVMALVAFIWFVVALTMKPLKKSKSYSFAMALANEDAVDEVAEQLINMPGVYEATLVYGEAVAYLKVDDKSVDLVKVKALLQA
jgi:predicted MFS family arabinose efflux permease